MFVFSSFVQACDSLGPIDVLINCAGFAVCGLFEETSIEDFKVGNSSTHSSDKRPLTKSGSDRIGSDWTRLNLIGSD